MESSNGSEFYDQKEVFDRYLKKREGLDNPNKVIEKPLILEMLSEVNGNVLDLGCGYGDLAKELIENGVKSYVGIDASSKMILQCKDNFSHPSVEYYESNLETWQYGFESNDWVISRLVFHYIQDLEPILIQINKSLKTNGQLLFSVEHPMLTSSIHHPRQKGKKENWLVDQYFEIGLRNQQWMGGNVKKYHRTLEEYWRILKSAGFQVEEIKERCPQRMNFQNESEYKRRSRIPLFLVIKAIKLN